jgi:hypothetical protein
MRKLPSMVDMARSPKEMAEGAVPQAPVYPYGLGICLCTEELEKLGVDYEDWQVGEHFHLFAMAKITSISKNETAEGENCRVELQIVSLEGESEEDIEGEEEPE